MAMTACRISRRWLVLAGTFVVLFFEMGTVKSYGLLINDITRDLQTTTALLGMAAGLSHGLSHILAIINIPLMKKFSARQLIMVGCLLGCLGIILSGFSQSGAHFAWAMGIAGTGFSIVVFPCYTCCSLDYFPDAFEKAVSFMLTGGGLGMMLLPLLTELLHRAYGWRGAIVLLGAFNLHYLVVGCLMKPVRTQGAKAQNQYISKDDKSKEGYVEVLQGLTDVSATVTRGECQLSPICREQVVLDECNGTTDKKWIGTPDREYVSTTDGDSFKSTNGTIIEPGENIANHNVYEFLKNLFDLRLFIKNPTFIFPLVVYFLFGITYTCWIVFVIPNAVAKGYTTGEGAVLATTGGAANIIGRFATGFVSSRDFVHEEVLCCLICLLAATAFFCNTFASSFWSLAVLSMMNGFASGAKIVMESLLAKKTLPLDLVSTGMCYLFLSQGIGEPLGGAIMGNIYDETRSYVLAFNVAALIEFLSAFVIVLPLLLRWYKSRTCQSNDDDADCSRNVNQTRI